MKIDWKKWFGKQTRSEKLKAEEKEAKIDESVPKDIKDKLPEGARVKQVVIGPQELIKAAIYLILVFWVVATIRQSFTDQNVEKVPISTVIEKVRAGEVEEVTVADNDVVVKIKGDKKLLLTEKEPTVSMTEILQKEGIDIGKLKITVDNRAFWKAITEALTVVVSVGLPLLLIIWFLRKSMGGAGGAGGMFGFGKSTAKLFIKGKQKITFKDVAGADEAKKDLEEVVDFLKNPAKYQKMGARVPKGVLLVGPSGVGKTLLAKAVAGEANVPFFSMAGSEFMEMLVGVGASRARDLFGTAKKAGRAIIFIDEIDAIGRVRGGMDGGHGEREQTLNQILVEMDGFEPNETVVVLAATNRADLLDPALMRPGRFDRRVVLEMPDLEARENILAIHGRNKPFDKAVDWKAISRRTVGFSGADLENLLNESAIGAARENRKEIMMEDVEEAALKVKLGAAKKRSQSEDDRKMTAYHEAGHAIVNYVNGLDPVHRISIVSRGMALGFTLIPPERDRVHETKTRLIKQMMMAMGGRAAEDLVFGDITTGAASDISHVTHIARNMVMEWGMSKLGPVSLGPQIDINDWGKAYMEPSKASEATMAEVDREIMNLVNVALEGAKKVLKTERKKLDKIAQLLVEKETLEQKEFELLMS